MVRGASFLLSPQPPLNYGFMWENQPQNLKGWKPQRLFLLLVRAGSTVASLLVFGGLGQRDSPHLGLTYPLGEGEKQENWKYILMVPKASPGNWHTALSNHISQLKAYAKPDTGEVEKHPLPKVTHSKSHDNRQRCRLLLHGWEEKIIGNNNAICYRPIVFFLHLH